MSRYSTVFSQLVTKLKLYSGWSDSNCAYPNRPFTMGSTAFWRVDIIPTSVDAAMGVGGSSHEAGILQITRYEPIKAGAGSALTAADAMASHFDRVKLTGAVTVQCGVPTVGPTMQETDWFLVPVSIPFTVL